MSRSPYTRSGTRRLGDDYQDLIALELMVNWFEHSDRYSWIRVEADEAKFLDDIVVMRADGRVDVKQVKFSTNPARAEDPFTWEKLLDNSVRKSGTTSQSLLQKWAVSLRQLQTTYDVADASLVSNRLAGADLAASIDRTSGLIAFDTIQDETQVKIIDQLGDETTAREFFEAFRFRLNEPSLDDLEDALRRRFDRFGGTEVGWLNLRNEVRLWVSHRYEPPPDGSIKLSDLRLAALWHALQSLPQRFQVPDDYVIPSADFHEEFQRTLLSGTGSCQVVNGSPGVGKSTYTSYLYEVLRDRDVPVIRHHYYLSQEDETSGIRLTHLRAAESLMHDLRDNYSESLGSHGGDNPLAAKFRDWLIASGEFYAEQNKQLAVILDGLDHVWRDTRSVEELSRLLNFILPAPAGVVVLLATQPVSDNQLPPALLKHAPRDSWHRLPLMDEAAVLSWLRHHETEFLPPLAGSDSDDRVRENQFARVGEALFEKSGGHPLHLRYTMRALQERDQLVTPENIAKLPGCEHEDIRDYYRKLWLSLSEEGKGILHLIAATQFPWSKRAILECLSPDDSRYSILSQSIKEVGHLLADTGLGLSAHHTSLIAYIQGLEEHLDFRAAMLRSALNWLRSRAPEYLRWAHEWVIEADLGNDTPLREGPTREWLIQAISKHYPYEQILNLLRRSIWCALERGDLPRAVEVGLLHDYCFRAFQSDPDILENLFIAQVTSGDGREISLRLRADVSELDDSQITLLARFEAGRGNMHFVGECFDELIRRINDRDDERTYHEWKYQALAVIEVAALLDDVNPAKIIDFILSNREDADAHEMLQTLAVTLRAERSGSRLKSVLMLEPSASDEFNVATQVNEREYIERHAVWLSLEEGFDLHNEALKTENADNPYYLIYAAIKGMEGIEARPARLPRVRLFASKSHSSGDPSRQRKDLFYSCAVGFVSNYLWGFQNSNKEFINTIGRHSKTGRCLVWLDLMSSRIASLFRTRKAPSFGLLYEGFKDFDDPAEGAAYDIEASGLRNDISRAVKHFALDLLSASVAIDGKAEISKADLEIAFRSGYCQWDAWMTEYVARRRIWLTDEALSWLLNDLQSRLEASVESLPERALTYSIVACVAARHERISDARQLIERAVANIVAHGHHKDALLVHTLNAIKECHNAGIDEAKEWLLQIATPIAYVDQFTDGDETGHLPRELAGTLLEVDPDRFPAYYAWLCDNEDSYDALHAFNSFVEIADLTSPLNRAIAATALDSGTLKILNERATQEAGARMLDSARSVLGDKGLQTSLREKSRSDSNSFTRQPSPVPPSSFPPANFEGYLAALDANERVWRGEHIEEWIQYWLTHNQGEAVFMAVDKAVARGVELRNYDQIFELALKLYGREQAYPWLVKAHKEQRGWNKYYSREEDAQRRWKYVFELYPDRWFDFIRQTLRSENETAPWQELYLDSGRAARLIEYCIRLNKLTPARDAMKNLVEGALQLVSMLPLTPPAWINNN